MTSTGRVARLTALALATGTLVAAGAGTAGAATTDKTTFNASGGGSVIRITVNLPSQLQAVTNAVLPPTLTQDIVLTGGNTQSGLNAAAIAQSILGAAPKGAEVPVLSSLLNKSVVAEYGKPQPASYSLLPQALKDGLAQAGIHVGALELASTAHSPNVDGGVAHSLSSVANLTVDGAGQLDAILAALNSQIQTILATVLGTATAGQLGSLSDITDVAGTTLDQVGTTVLGSLQPVLDQITAISGSSQVSDTVKQAANTLLAQVKALPDVLTATLKANAADDSLLHVGLIESEQTVDRAAGVMTSTTTNKLVDVSALMGLIHIDGLTSAATAALGNGVSDATADKGQNAVLKVGVKGLLTAELGSDLGVTLTGLPAELQPLADQLQGAINQITGLLNDVLGATLTQTKVESLVKDKNHASSSVAAARLLVNPTLPGVGPLFDKPLLDISFVPAMADVKAQASVPPAVITPGKATQQQMARTGANFGLTAPIAVTLMGLAVVARRRRLAHLEG